LAGLSLIRKADVASRFDQPARHRALIPTVGVPLIRSLIAPPAVDAAASWWGVMRWLSKLFASRKRSDEPPEGSVLPFHGQVEACMEALNPGLMRLRHRYPDPAIAAALAMHTVAAFSACVRDASMTPEEAKRMLLLAGRESESFEALLGAMPDRTLAARDSHGWVSVLTRKNEVEVALWAL
jgi:hypothetical protein